MDPTTISYHSPPPTVADPARRKGRLPILTLLACAACVIVFIGINSERKPNSWEAFARWGVYDSERLRGGAYWGFITSVFVHLELWHLAFNVYWLYLFGSRLERAIGFGPWLAFFLGAAVVSSGAEFALTDSTGIGASGVGYALFGFLWVTRNHFPAFKAVLNPQTVSLFIFWLIGCVVLTALKVWQVGNAAHIAGLLYGAACGAWVVFKPHRKLAAIGISALILAAVIPLFWAPWSFEWTSWQGVRAHKKGDYASAILWYERSMKLGQDRSWGWQNIALAYYSAGDKAHGDDALKILRTFDEPAAREIEMEIKPK